MTGIRARRVQVETVRMLLLAVGLVLIGVPFLWILLTAFKRPVDASSVPPEIFSPFTTRNFRDLNQNGFVDSLANSAILTVTTMVCTLGFGVPAGYAFARGRFRGRWFLGGFLLFSRMVPPVVFIIPLFLFFNDFGLVGTYTGLTLAYLTGLLPFAVWMSASYFQDIPIELEEAARVDGASRAQAFFRIALPLALPGVVSVGLLIAIAAWSEYFIPLILAGPSTTPATVGIVSFVGVDSINWGAMAAGALALVVPVFLATLLAQRGLLRGLTAGAVKG
ncbi:carbohydrate ABC transporter permease [Nakamurella endophytica]|uniref:ABC transporter permease n=1 Tax=Nakamurella endophytica TaxID=1748367 RepID=A0A917WLY0_9ACTN|nr:carbohydrate ABC transporter permease [Nakamurella endophytica]GGM14003.1 ABC transporter permease [Nakamurella endophytica]